MKIMIRIQTGFGMLSMTFATYFFFFDESKMLGAGVMGMLSFILAELIKLNENKRS